MTTENFKEIRNAIATIKQKRFEIIGLQEDLDELREDYERLLYDFHNNPAYAEIVEIAAEIALLNDLGGSEDSSIEQFPVDEPLTDIVENWEAKDVPPSDEAFATAFSCFSSGVSDVSSHHPTGQKPDAAPGLSNELESATGGDARADSTFQPIAF
ncbi:MAG: hypothetical protein INF44_02470 [Thalassospira sp.]|nr:hypothetical protein [Thalassospira sp.]